MRAALLIILEPGYRHSILTAKDNGSVAVPSWLQVSRISFPFYDIGRAVGHPPSVSTTVLYMAQPQLWSLGLYPDVVATLGSLYSSAIEPLLAL